MGEVKLSFLSNRNDYYLHDSDHCMTDALVKKLESFKKYHPKEAAVLYKAQIGKHLEDTLYNIANDDLTIDFEFAKNLKLFDTLSVRCLKSDTKEGKCLIELIYSADLRFMVYKREWSDINTIELYLPVCHTDYEHRLHIDLISGEYEY